MIINQYYHITKLHLWRQLKLLLLVIAICAVPFGAMAQLEQNQAVTANGAGLVSGGNYTGYASAGQIATYMFANGSYIATQGIILNEISGDVEFTFELTGNLTDNNNANTNGLVLKSTAAELIGEPLRNTQVYLILVETGEVYASTTTDADGYFEFLHVPYLDFYFVVEEPIIPSNPVLLNFEESTVFVKDVEINGEVGTEGITAEVVLTPQATTVSEEESKSLYIDKDRDGFGFGTVKVRLNVNASEIGYSENNSDCDDNDPNVFPDAIDIAGSGIDANCDGIYLWYFDKDGDGLGTSQIVESGNSEPGVGEANNNLDTNDSEPTLCANIELILDYTGQINITADDISIFESNTDESFIATPSTFDCSDIGTPKTTAIITTSSTGIQKYCGAQVTVIGTIPEVEIVESMLPEFCQGAVVRLTAESEDAISYEWSNDGDSQVTEVSTNGIHKVMVTSSTGCTASAEYIINGFNAQYLLSAYTILATEEVHLHNSNIVSSGGVGVTKKGKAVKLHESSHVYDFVQASKIEIKDGSTVATSINTPANIELPAFVYNKNSKGKGKNIKIKKNKTETLTGEVYGKVEIEEGARAIFTASDIYFDEIKTKKGVSIEFENCANLYVRKHFQLEENCTFNPGQFKVVVFVDEKVEIKEGCFVSARIHANNNDIHVKGSKRNPTTMNGMFIGKKIHGDKYVNWNMDRNCDNCNDPSLDIHYVEDKSGEIVTSITALDNELEVKAYPNPTKGKVVLEIAGTTSAKIKVQVMNIAGQRIFEQEYLKTDRIELNLEGNTAGLYFVNVYVGDKQFMNKIILQNR